MSAMLIDGRFVAVFPRLVRALGGDTTAAAVVQAIHYRAQADRDGWVELSMADIADEIGISPDQARRACRRLADAGLLVGEGDAGKARRWRIDHDALTALDTPANPPVPSTPANPPDPEPRRNRRTTPANPPDHPGEIAGPSFLLEVQEVDLELSPPAAAHNHGRTYADAFAERHGNPPPRANVGRVARDATRLVAEGQPPDLVDAACAAAARQGHANVTAALTALVTERTRDDIYSKPAKRDPFAALAERYGEAS